MKTVPLYRSRRGSYPKYPASWSAKRNKTPTFREAEARRHYDSSRNSNDDSRSPGKIYEDRSSDDI